MPRTHNRPMSPKPVLRRVCADAANALQKCGRGRVWLDLSANPAYTCVDTARRDKLQISPDRVQERVPGESLSLMARHVVEEAELQGSGSDFLAAHRDSHRGRVDENVAGRAGWRIMGASQYGSDPKSNLF